MKKIANLLKKIIAGKVKAPFLIIMLVLYAFFALEVIQLEDVRKAVYEYTILENYLTANQTLLSAYYEGTEEERSQALEVLERVDPKLKFFLGSEFILSKSINNKDSLSESFNQLLVRWNTYIRDYRQGKEELPEINKSFAFFMEAVYLVGDNVEEFRVRSDGYKKLVMILSVIFIFLIIAISYLFLNKKVSYKDPDSEVRSVTQGLLMGQEKERMRISLELHDKVAQDLFAVKMSLMEFSQGIEKEERKQAMDQILDLLNSSINEVRDLSYTLRPPSLQALGLDSAISSYIDNLAGKIDVPINYRSLGMKGKSIKEDISINLYRILQETLNNTVKHAHANNIDVRLIYTHPFLLLKIEDDGVGFKYVKSDVKSKGGKHLGLPGIQERVTLLNGELIINTKKGEGSRILIRVPVKEYEKV